MSVQELIQCCANDLSKFRESNLGYCSFWGYSMGEWKHLGSFLTNDDAYRVFGEDKRDDRYYECRARNLAPLTDDQVRELLRKHNQ